MKLGGITGTSGKTTTAFIVYTVLRKLGKNTGLIGTIEYRINDEVIPATNTTPDILFLNRLMAQMVEKGVEYLIMEVSSHSLALGRVAGLNFDIAAFTSFSQDHLDFHKTMEEYLLAKLKIFDLLNKSIKPGKIIIVNREIDRFNKIEDYSRQFPEIKFKTFSIKDKNSDYYSRVIKLNSEGSAFQLNKVSAELRGINPKSRSLPWLRGMLVKNKINISMMGITNVYNFTLASAILMEFGLKLRDFKEYLQNIQIKGRMENVPTNKGFSVIIDYAHKPDALEKLLFTVREIIKEKGRIITVFGCGGDRDKIKRPIMGKIAGKLSDTIIITSDNPRTEDPFLIIKEIEAGLRESGNKNYFIEENRAKAISLTLSLAGKDDVVIIAGKGHEDYQILGKTKIHFSDREEVEKLL